MAQGVWPGRLRAAWWADRKHQVGFCHCGKSDTSYVELGSAHCEREPAYGEEQFAYVELESAHSKSETSYVELGSAHWLAGRLRIFCQGCQDCEQIGGRIVNFILLDFSLHGLLTQDRSFLFKSFHHSSMNNATYVLKWMPCYYRYFAYCMSRK